MMTPDQLEMLKRLKAPIDKYMGPWRIGDKCYSIYHSQTGFIIDTSQNSYRYTHVVFDSGMEVKCKVDNMEMYLRIPPFATPDGKRCLLGLLQSLNNDYLTRHLKLECIDGVWIVNTVLTNSWSACDKDPYTAILKALCEQEEV
jgi:hypothetical protein